MFDDYRWVLYVLAAILIIALIFASDSYKEEAYDDGYRLGYYSDYDDYYPDYVLEEIEWYEDNHDSSVLSFCKGIIDGQAQKLAETYGNEYYGIE